MEAGMGSVPSAGRPFIPQHRNNAPYSLLHQQQGMMGAHASMPSHAAMSNAGQRRQDVAQTRRSIAQMY